MYAAPAYFIMENAMGECAIIRESPNVTNVACIRIPVLIPNVA